MHSFFKIMLLSSSRSFAFHFRATLGFSFFFFSLGTFSFWKTFKYFFFTFGPEKPLCHSRRGSVVMPTSTSSKNIYLFSALSFFSTLCTRLTHLLLSFANLFTFDPTKRLCLSQWGSVVMPPSPILPHTSSYLNWALTGINKDHYTLSFPSLPLPVLNQGHNSKSRSELQLDQCSVYEEEEEPVKKGISQPLWKHHNINCQDLIRAPRTVVHKTSNATCPFLQGCFQMCKSIHTLSPSISSDLSEFELLLLPRGWRMVWKRWEFCGSLPNQRMREK